MVESWMPPKTPQENWNFVLKHYQSYPDYEWWRNLKPFAELVGRIADSPWAERTYASTSHETLIVAQVNEFPERLKRPHVVIKPMNGEISLARLMPRRRTSENDRLEPTECVDHQIVPIDLAWEPLVGVLEWLTAAR